MFNRLPGIGLDLGDQTIKLAQVKRRQNGLQLVKYGSLPMPAGAFAAGIIQDPERLGQELQGLVKQLNLTGQQVVSAVTGQQVYIRNLILPSMKLKELKAAVHYQATNFLPIPVEEAAIDIFPLRNFEDEEGKKTEIFFVAVRRRQVENLATTCRAAGLRLAVVEIEPLALYRVLGGTTDSVTGFIELGLSRSYFAVFKGINLVFYQSLPVGCSALEKIFKINSWYRPDGFNEAEIGLDQQYDHLTGDITVEIKRMAEYYVMQGETGPEEIDNFILCGRGAAIRALHARLIEELGCQVEVADILPRIIAPPHLSAAQKLELQYDFNVTLGLAAREVV